MDNTDAPAGAPAGFALRHPFQAGDGRTVDRLAMRDPQVRDLKAAARFGGSDAEQEVALLAILCGLLPEDLERMHLADFRTVQTTFRQMVD